jgi:hypothetical protein
MFTSSNSLRRFVTCQLTSKLSVIRLQISCCSKALLVLESRHGRAVVFTIKLRSVRCSRSHVEARPSFHPPTTSSNQGGGPRPTPQVNQISYRAPCWALFGALFRALFRALFGCRCSKCFVFFAQPSTIECRYEDILCAVSLHVLRQPYMAGAWKRTFRWSDGSRSPLLLREVFMCSLM